MKKPAFATWFCAFLILSATAHGEQFTVAAIGAGSSKSCADFVVASGNIKPGISLQTTLPDGERLVSDNQQYLEWAFGFISGANLIIRRAAPKNYHQVTRLSAAGTDLWLRNYCNQNPNAGFKEAVFAFIGSEGIFLLRRTREGSPPDLAKP